MAGTSKFPTALDDGTTLYQPGSGDLVASVDHAALHDNVDVAIIATQTKVGIGASTPVASTLLRGTGTGTSAYAQAVLTTDVTGTLPVANGGTGVTGSTGSGNNVLSNSPTLSAPVFTSISNTGTLTLPTSTDTLVGRATTDTLTNKTIAGGSNTITGIGPNSLATGAQYAVVTTLETTTSSSYVDLTTTTDTVTLNIGANGLAVVIMSAEMFNSTSGDYASMAFAISGATTRAAASPYEVFTQSTATSSPDNKISYSVLVTGLTPGSTTFKLKYKIIVGGTGSFQKREISVIPL